MDASMHGSMDGWMHTSFGEWAMGGGRTKGRMGGRRRDGLWGGPGRGEAATRLVGQEELGAGGGPGELPPVDEDAVGERVDLRVARGDVIVLDPAADGKLSRTKIRVHASFVGMRA